MNLSTFFLILTGVLLNAAAQIFLKAGTNALGALSASSVVQTLHTVKAILMQPQILGGLTCYVLSVGIWIVALSKTQVSVAYPMLSMGYIANALAAWYLFGEPFSPSKLIGMAIIIVGVIVIARP